MPTERDASAEQPKRGQATDGPAHDKAATPSSRITPERTWRVSEEFERAPDPRAAARLEREKRGGIGALLHFIARVFSISAVRPTGGRGSGEGLGGS